jgi:hypothetical protein
VAARMAAAGQSVALTPVSPYEQTLDLSVSPPPFAAPPLAPPQSPASALGPDPHRP